SIMEKGQKPIIHFVYQNDLRYNTADVNQTLSMLNAIAKLNPIIFYCSWISAEQLKLTLDSLSLHLNFETKRIPVRLKNKDRFEKIKRVIFNSLVYLNIKRENNPIVLTRDFGFIYFLSVLPRFLKIKGTICFEAHKIY